MAKARSKETPSDSPLERTAKLAKKLLAVPKREVDKVKRKQSQRHGSSNRR
jgi:hypothetical protein